MGARLSYTLSLTRQLRLELNAGVKNLFDSFQHDLDFGQRKDAAYIYGPAAPAHLFHRCEIRVMTLRGVLPMESQPVAENARLPSYERGGNRASELFPVSVTGLHFGQGLHVRQAG